MKVLVISYYFPPQTSVGGFRTTRFLDAFAASGLEAVVLTVRNPDRQFHPYQGEMTAEDSYAGFPVYRVKPVPVKWLWQWPTRLVKLFMRLLGRSFSEGEFASRFWYVDMEYGWNNALIPKAKKLIGQHKPDLIYVSCPPFSSALAAARLKRISGLPLVLDFRDSWQFSPYIHASDRKNKKIEDALLAQADALIVTTPTDQENYSTLESAPPVHLIHNGYDAPFVLNDLPKSGKFSLLYLGAWDGAARDPRRLLAGLADCEFDWELVSVGNTNGLVEQAAAEFGLSHRLRCLESRPKTELIPLIQESAALVLLQGAPRPGAKNTHIASKTFDYLATGRPILAVMGAGDNRDFLSSFANSAYVSDVDSPAEITSSITKLHSDWESGQASTKPDAEFLELFGGRGLTAKLRKVFEAVLNS